MTWVAKGVAGIFFCHVFLLLCQWASTSPVETHTVQKSKYEQFWEPVNNLVNRIQLVIFRITTFVVQWVPGLQEIFVRPEIESPVVATPVRRKPAARSRTRVAKSPMRYCFKNSVPLPNECFRYKYHD